jgi:hypothetical protein
LSLGGEVVSVEGPSSRELYHCRKNIYDILLKAGDKGVTLHEIMENISYSPEAVRKSLIRLEPSAYNGPRDLIKKGRRFKARATITKIEDRTTVLIHDVVEA